MRQQGILLSACANGHNVLKIRPPLILSEEQAAMVIRALDQALTEAAAARTGQLNPVV